MNVMSYVNRSRCTSYLLTLNFSSLHVGHLCPSVIYLVLLLTIGVEDSDMIVVLHYMVLAVVPFIMLPFQ